MSRGTPLLNAAMFQIPSLYQLNEFISKPLLSGGIKPLVYDHKPHVSHMEDVLNF